MKLTRSQTSALTALIQCTADLGFFPGEKHLAEKLDADRCIQQLKSLERKGYVEQCGDRGRWKATRDENGCDLIWVFDGDKIHLGRRSNLGVRYSVLSKLATAPQ